MGFSPKTSFCGIFKDPRYGLEEIKAMHQHGVRCMVPRARRAACQQRLQRLTQIQPSRAEMARGSSRDQPAPRSLRWTRIAPVHFFGIIRVIVMPN
jgi:hypothetical protein